MAGLLWSPRTLVLVVAGLLLVLEVALAREDGMQDLKQKLMSRMQRPDYVRSNRVHKSLPTGLTKRERAVGPKEPPSLYSLIPGRYPNSRSLPSVLEALPDTSEGRAVVQQLLDYIKQKTGYTVPEAWIDLALNDSYGLLDELSFSPSELHDMAVVGNLDVDPVNYTTQDPRVPSGFVYPDDIAGFPLNMTDYIPSIAPVGAGLYLGFFFPNTTSIAQAKINVVTSFIFNQLSDNLHLSPNSPDYFVLRFNGQDVTSVEAFVTAILAQSSHNSISTYVTKRIAAFFGLYVNTPEGEWLEVADPLMVSTGFYSVGGLEQAILPAIHSEWILEVSLKDTSFNIVWYQGDDGIGFFPGNMYVLESWVGGANGPVISGADAVRAIHFMSLFGDILRQIYITKKLGLFGYAITGVCDDSCGAIEMLTAGASTEYPNLIMKSLVLPEILQRIRQRDIFSHYYYDLLTVVSSMPEDWSGPADATAPSRALGTIVWPEGQEPFQCVVDSRAILNELVNERHTTLRV